MKRQATPSFMANASAALAPLRARWSAMSPRERYLTTLAASAIGILLVWAIALAPALDTLQKVKTRRIELDSQLQQMLALQGEARQLAALPHIGREAAVRALQESVTALGTGAQMQVNGERALVTLHGVPAASVASWLGQARTNARVAPVEARLVRSPTRVAAPALSAGAKPPGTAPVPPVTVNDDVRWDGTFVLNLPSN